VLAVQLYGYESLGLEFAKLLVAMRPDLADILEDEATHVKFFEREIRQIIAGEAAAADQARVSARAWWRKVPLTLGRYMEAPVLNPFSGEINRVVNATPGTHYQLAASYWGDKPLVNGNLFDFAYFANSRAGSIELTR